MEEGRERQHVVLFPFMAQGHITPFLSLAELILHRNPTYTVTLVNTPLNIQNIQSSLPPNSPIHLRSLPFRSSDHGLPPDTESTAALPFHHFTNLFRAANSLQPAFEQLIFELTQQDGRPPLCIIADSFLGWTVDIARKLKIFHSIFITNGAYGMAVYISLWRHQPHTLTTSDEFPLPDFPEVRIHKSQLPKHLLLADGSDVWSVILRRLISLCFESDAVLINSVEEFERTGLSMLRRTFAAIPIWTVGPLLRLPAPSSSSSPVVQWLGSHTAGTVLYVSFGSQNTITAAQMMELAVGLEASGTPFIWVIRPPVGFDINGEFRPEWLPEGFEQRMEERGQGLVVHGWAPQVEILSHESTGGFLSHCGWNSVLEGLSSGVLIIGWPLSGEQSYNSQMLEEVGVCVEVARGNMETSRVEREKVERVVREVMGGTEKGKEMRERAAGIGEAMRKALREDGEEVGSSVRGLGEFLRLAVRKREFV